MSQAEIEQGTTNIVDAVFANEPPKLTGAPIGREAFADRIAVGGYPEALTKKTQRSREKWFNERFVGAVLEPEEYPDGTAFLPSDAPDFAEMLAASVSEHRPVAVIYPDGREVGARPEPINSPLQRHVPPEGFRGYDPRLYQSPQK